MGDCLLPIVIREERIMDWTPNPRHGHTIEQGLSHNIPKNKCQAPEGVWHLLYT